MDKRQMMREPYYTLDEIMAMYGWSSKTTAIRRVRGGAFTLPDGASGAYKLPGRTGEWRVLKAAVDHSIETMETSPPATTE